MASPAFRAAVKAWLLAAACALAPRASAATAPAEEEDIIIIEDEDAPAAAPPATAPPPGAAEDEDVIIIMEDEPTASAPTGPPRPPVPSFLPRIPAPFDLPDIPLPLGEIPLLPGPDSPTSSQAEGRTLLGLKPHHVTLTGTFGFRSSLRPMGSLRDDAWRNLAFATASVDIRPDAPVRAHADLWVRARSAVGTVPVPLDTLTALDVALPWRRVDVRNRFSGMVELGEVYVSARLPVMRITAGRQLYAWSAALTSPLTSILNAPDIRDGVAFPDELSARTPVAALTLQGDLGPVQITAMMAPFHAPPRAPLYAEDAEAYDPNEPVLPFITSRASVGDAGLAAALQRQVPTADALQLGQLSPTGGLRAFFTALGWDVMLATVAGHDPLPVVHASPGVARALALAADRAPAGAVKGALLSACIQPGCQDLDGQLRYRWRRTLALQAEGSRAVGPVVVRTSAYGIPRVADWGRQAHVVMANGELGNANLGVAGGTLAVESGYAELVQGFVELGYELMWGIPAGARLARFSPAVTPFPFEHGTHRPTLSVRLQGILLDDITWRVRGTVAPWQRDLGLAPRVGYRLSLAQEVSLGVDLFAGWQGSRGAFLAPQGRTYLEWLYRF